MPDTTDVLLKQVLDTLQEIEASAGVPGGTLAQEGTLQAVLSQLMANNDLEILVGYDTVTQIVYSLRISRDQGTGVITQAWYDVNGNLFVPVNPMAFMSSTTQLNQLIVLTQGISDKMMSGLVSEAHDNVEITYVAAGNGIGQIETAVYKLAAATVATITCTYDAQDRLDAVVKS